MMNCMMHKPSIYHTFVGSGMMYADIFFVYRDRKVWCTFINFSNSKVKIKVNLLWLLDLERVVGSHLRNFHKMEKDIVVGKKHLKMKFCHSTKLENSLAAMSY